VYLIQVKYRCIYKQRYASHHHGVRDLFHTEGKFEAYITLHMLKILTELRYRQVMKYNALATLEGCCGQYRLKVACMTNLVGLQYLFYIYFLIGT